MDLIKREIALNIIKSKLEKEELNLKTSTTEYRKRVTSYSIAILRDLYDMVNNIDKAK